jgi:hypothetical protein
MIPEEFQRLIAEIRQASNEFVIRSSDFSSGQISSLIQEIRDNKFIRVVNLKINKPNFPNIKKIIEQLKLVKFIKEIHLSDANIGKSLAQQICIFLRNSSIEKLTLRKVNLKGKAVECLGELIRNIPIIDFSYNSIGPDGAKVISKFVRKNHFIRKLKISHNPIGNFGAKAVAKSLVDKRINALYLSSTKITDEVFFEIASILRHNHYISTIYCQGNGLTSDFVGYMNDILDLNPCITEVRFHTPRGADAILISKMNEKLAANKRFLSEAVELILEKPKDLEKEHIWVLKANYFNKHDHPVNIQLVESYIDIVAKFLCTRLNRPYDIIKVMLSYLNLQELNDVLKALFLAKVDKIDHVQEFDNLLAPHGLQAVDVDKDGNCFFSALGRQLGKDAQELRAIAVNYMLNDPDQFRGFAEKDIDSYINEVSKNGVWADNLVIQAIANELHLAIDIYRADGEVTHIIPRDGEDLESARLAYTGNHYLSIEESAQHNATQASEEAVGYVGGLNFDPFYSSDSSF